MKRLLLFLILASGAMGAELDPAAPKAVEPKTASKKAGELGKYRKIIDRAPFRNALVPAAIADAASGNTALKLNGIIRIGNRLLAGIEDTGQQRSMILAVGQNERGVEILAIDEATQTVSLTHDGRPVPPLTLEKTPSMGPPPANPAGVPGNPHSIPLQPGPAFQPPPGATNTAPTQNPRRRKSLIVPRTQ